MLPTSAAASVSSTTGGVGCGSQQLPACGAARPRRQRIVRRRSGLFGDSTRAHPSGQGRRRIGQLALRARVLPPATATADDRLGVWRVAGCACSAGVGDCTAGGAAKGEAAAAAGLRACSCTCTCSGVTVPWRQALSLSLAVSAQSTGRRSANTQASTSTATATTAAASAALTELQGPAIVSGSSSLSHGYVAYAAG